MKEYLLAGFGGQGLLFAGKFLACMGMIEEKQVSWMPSYGPEMRGGTANCSVSISAEPIGSPLVVTPNLLVAMNLPSLDAFINKVEPGGSVILDSSLISKKVEREDMEVHYLPATRLAEDGGLKGLANIIMLGKVVAVTGAFSAESLEKGLAKSIPARKQHLLESNLAAVKIGMSR